MDDDLTHSTCGARVFLDLCDNGSTAVPDVVLARAPITLSQGNHTITAKATDNKGNSGVASVSFSVDSLPTDTTITIAQTKLGKPIANNSRTSSTSIKFTFTETDNPEISGFECKLGEVHPPPYSNPISYSALAKGTHNFQVRAKDTAGNADLSSAVFMWTIVRYGVK